MSTTTLDPQTAARLRRRRLIITVLVASLIIHLAGGIGAGIWIVARYFLPPTATFEVKKEIRIAAEEREHRMNMAEFDAGLVLRKRLTVTGSTLRPRSVAFKAAIAEALKRNVWPLLESGKVRPAIYREFDAADAAQAHALMESSQHTGKIVLTWET